MSAPYGYGRPPACYWRRDSKSQPMDMTDLQNKFWEMRTRRERITDELRDARARFANDMQIPRGLGYRFTAVSESPLEMRGLVSSLRGNKIVPSGGRSYQAIAYDPLWSNHDWGYSAFGAEKTKLTDRPPMTKWCRWVIDETGVVDVIGYIVIAENEVQNDLIVDPYDFAATSAHLLYLATYLKKIFWRSTRKLGA